VQHVPGWRQFLDNAERPRRALSWRTILLDAEGKDLEAEDMWTIGVILIAMIVVVILFVINP
jgi:hypothetical protein